MLFRSLEHTCPKQNAKIYVAAARRNHEQTLKPLPMYSKIGGGSFARIIVDFWFILGELLAIWTDFDTESLPEHGVFFC